MRAEITLTPEATPLTTGSCEASVKGAAGPTNSVPPGEAYRGEPIESAVTGGAASTYTVADLSSSWLPTLSALWKSTRRTPSLKPKGEA